MKIDNKLWELPLTKSNPKTLESLFGKKDIQPFWVADMEFQIAKPIQKSLIPVSYTHLTLPTSDLV